MQSPISVSSAQTRPGTRSRDRHPNHPNGRPFRQNLRNADEKTHRQRLSGNTTLAYRRRRKPIAKQDHSQNRHLDRQNRCKRLKSPSLIVSQPSIVRHTDQQRRCLFWHCNSAAFRSFIAEQRISSHIRLIFSTKQKTECNAENVIENCGRIRLRNHPQT